MSNNRDKAWAIIDGVAREVSRRRQRGERVGKIILSRDAYTTLVNYNMEAIGAEFVDNSEESKDMLMAIPVEVDETIGTPYIVTDASGVV